MRTKFLQHGGAKEASDLLNDLVGDGVLKKRNGGIVPDITSLCEEMNLVDGVKLREGKSKISLTY